MKKQLKIILSCALAGIAVLIGVYFGLGNTSSADILNVEDKPKQTLNGVLNANGEYTNIDDIMREKQEYADWLEQNPQPETTMSPEDEAELEALFARLEALQEQDKQSDRDALNIYKRYTGNAVMELPLNRADELELMRSMLDLLDDRILTYDEFDTMFRYFLRRIDRIRENDPEFEDEMDVVFVPLVDYYDYVYIPDGRE